MLCRGPQGRGGACALCLQAGRSSTHHVLHRVGVEGDDAYGSCPLVVFLMDFLVQFWVVKKPGKRLIVNNLPVSLPTPPTPPTPPLPPPPPPCQTRRNQR